MVSAVIAIGTFCRLSLRLVAVTTISWSSAGGVLTASAAAGGVVGATAAASCASAGPASMVDPSKAIAV